MNKEDIEPLLKEFKEGNAYVKITTKSCSTDLHQIKAMIDSFSGGEIVLKKCSQTEDDKFLYNLDYKNIANIEELPPEEWKYYA